MRKATLFLHARACMGYSLLPITSQIPELVKVKSEK